jgi:hypothetical protein
MLPITPGWQNAHILTKPLLPMQPNWQNIHSSNDSHSFWLSLAHHSQ